MVFPLLTPGPALSLSPLVLLVPRSRLDFLFLHVGFSLHQEESSSFPLFPFAPSIIVSHSLSLSLYFADAISRSLPPRHGSARSLPLPDSSIRRLALSESSPSDHLSSSLPFSPSFDPHRWYALDVCLPWINVPRDSLLVSTVVKVAPCRCSRRRAAGRPLRRRSTRGRRSRLHVFTPALSAT